MLLALCACSSNQPAAKPASGPTAQAGAQPADRAQLTNEVSAMVAVVAVDAPSRVVTLRREDGSMLQIKCGPEVRNFAQITAGDTLRVHYKETLTASRRPAGEPAAPAEAAAIGGRSAAGATPAGGVGVAISVRVKVESIDREREIVVFSTASGEVVARRIATPEGREFLKGLKVGDTVQLDYAEALALSVDKL